jgi:hypothetical protein
MDEFDSMPKYDQGVPITYTVAIEDGAAEELRQRGYSVELVSYGENRPLRVPSRPPSPYESIYLLYHICASGGLCDPGDIA